MAAIAKRKAEAEIVSESPKAAAVTPSLIEQMILDPSVSIERANQAFEFFKKVQAEDSRKAFVADLIKAQTDMEPVRKDARNAQTKSNYATFDALDRAVRPIYTKYGFAPTYHTEPSTKPDHVLVVMMLMHSAGHERRYEADMPADGKGAKGGDVMTKTHAFGSAFSYGKRYTLGGAFNIVTTERDDDGNAAGKSQELITPEQAEELTKLITETGTDIHKFLEFGKIESLSDMVASAFPRAKALLVAKKNKAGAK